MSLTQSIHRGRQMFGDRPALVSDERSLSYSELYDEVSLCAGAWSGLGLEPGSTLGILAINSGSAIVAFYGALWAGVVPNYLNTRWSASELSASVDDFSPAVLVVDDTFLEMGCELARRCKSVKTLVYFGGQSAAGEGVLHYDELKDSATPLADSSGRLEDLAFLNYTGGTTGKGKGVMHSHGSYACAMAMMISEGFLTHGTTLLVAPLFHITGMGISSGALMLGNTLHIQPSFDPAKVLALIEEKSIEQSLMVPTMWQLLLHHPNFESTDLSSLKYARYGASPMDETVLLSLKEKLPWVDFMQAYGQTEGVPATLLHDCDHSQAGAAAGKTRSAGRAAYGVEVKIRDAEGMVLPAGEAGEITLRGPQLMLGYLHNEEETRKVLRDGWLYTGDAGYFSEEGYLFMVDRLKDMIISGGENVYSLEVESALNQHDAIAQCAVVGLPDKKWGERVHAEVVLHSGAEIKAEELMDFCREYLAAYKLPRSVNFVEHIPLTAVGKVDKVTIRTCLGE